ncbi:restriction endonuclease [Chryseobacterium bernardetii]|uniref:restriction endonuclease n=1 Tax=Chryseobacterium bernardetii TaxID=1241978 RepID=UPI0030196EAB
MIFFDKLFKNSTEKGKKFEDYIAFIYEQLLLLDNIKVEKGLILEKNGNKHQIDIYYEFIKAQNLHRVAIECKNWERPVDKKELASFESYINDLKNITGVVVAKNGFTDGAKTYAESKGLILKTPQQLPDFMQSVGLNLQKVYMPSKDESGEPFYTLLCVNNGDNWNGEYYLEGFKDMDIVMPLFISRKHGEDYLKRIGEVHLAVFPLKKQHINFIADMAIKNLGGFKGLRFSLMLLPFSDEVKPMRAVFKAKDFKEEYL